MIRNRVEKTVEKEDGTEVKIVIKKPTNEVQKAADRIKAKVWNECLIDNILTKKELDALMEKRGIWNKEKTDEQDKLTKAISDLEVKLYRGENGKKPKVSEGKKFAIEIRQKRLKLMQLIAERNQLQENTAESLAENAKFDYLVAHCTFNEDDSPIYASFEDYNNNSTDEIAFAAASSLGEMVFGLDPDFELNLPENKFLKKFKLIDGEGSLCDPNDGEKVDVDGCKIDEEGYFLNKDGDRVDKNGLPVTKDGTYELIDYENDLSDSSEETDEAKPVKKRRTKKSSTTETTATDS